MVPELEARDLSRPSTSRPTIETCINKKSRNDELFLMDEVLTIEFDNGNNDEDNVRLVCDDAYVGDPNGLRERLGQGSWVRECGDFSALFM